MKTFKGLVLGVFVTGIILMLSSVSFASGKHHKIDLGLIKKAADALQAMHPELATGLMKYVDDENKEELEKKNAKSEKEGVAEEKSEKEIKGQQEKTIKLFKDSAKALKTKNPKLSASLTKYAQWKEKRMKVHKAEKEDSEKGEENEMKAEK